MLEDNDGKNSIKINMLSSNPLKFQCSQCGACCRRAGKTGFMEDRGDGGCIYLTEENKCAIYDTRPELCNMEKMWIKRNEELDLELRGISKKDYFIENSQACNFMMQQDEMDSKFRIDIEKYDEMEDEMNKNKKEEEEELVNFDEKTDDKKKELYCCHCEDVLILTKIISLNNQVNIRCYNDECGSTGFIARGILYQSEPSSK